jgi:hypothetical protein
MLVAGAPCQGFSQLNHHPGSQPVMEKVGNVVLPPMGQAIGLEILKSLRGETFLELKI